MHLFQHASKDIIYKRWIIDAVVNSHCVVIHLRAAIRTNHFCCWLHRVLKLHSLIEVLVEPAS